MRRRISLISLLVVLLMGLMTVYSAQAVVEPPDDPPTTSTPTNSTPAPDSDGDGVPNSLDQCPNEHGTQVTQGCPDSDWDGTRDSQDNCPNDIGPISNGGCPIPIDNDGDGVPNVNDNCPYNPGPASNNGCPVSTPAPDNDGDGIPNTSDSCPDSAGPASNNGCPVSTPPPDDDGDGILNASDSCPNKAGPVWNAGCPLVDDYDDDGVANHRDNCPYTHGPVSNNGCPVVNTPPPDNDGDGILNDSDSCPNEAGPAWNDGCPLSDDYDDDGVSNDRDNCPYTAGPASNNGCPVSTPAPDADGDGVNDSTDNCPNIANPDQSDLDSDGIGDACDDENTISCPDRIRAVSGLGCFNITRECSQPVEIEDRYLGTLRASLALSYDMQNGQFIRQSVLHGVTIPPNITGATDSFSDFNTEETEYGWLVSFIFSYTVYNTTYDVLAECGELFNLDDDGTPRLVRLLNTLIINRRVTPPTATPTPTSTPSEPIAYALDNINIREGDNTNYRVIGTFPNGANAQILGISPAGWYYIGYRDGDRYIEGYVTNQWVNTSGNLSNLPLKTPPALPTPTPTAPPPPANTIVYEDECTKELSEYIIPQNQINAVMNYINSVNFNIKLTAQNDGFRGLNFMGFVGDGANYIVNQLAGNTNVASININESVLRDAIKAGVMAAIENAIHASSASFVGPYIIHYQYNETTNQITPILSLALQPSFRGVTFFSAIDFTGDNEPLDNGSQMFIYQAIGTSFSTTINVGGSINAGVSFIAEGDLGFNISASIPINLYFGPIYVNCTVTQQDLIDYAHNH